jgi:hypothetical protein
LQVSAILAKLCCLPVLFNQRQPMVVVSVGEIRRSSAPFCDLRLGVKTELAGRVLAAVKGLLISTGTLAVSDLPWREAQ